ncbi:NYN domain-containing protein [Nocardioides sp. ChNu-153]|uniref:NYN domain-containing protein n=1 Tax=unclassified Nocardioides TaxID=2615069 RepID=UPI0024049EBD|nr:MULTISPECIES: NYN domain-containing protein [unclassified Nocardioides]MDF9717151.1 NYN domain-containing protein [Nocardioides sp. ChNu-99]MDN7122678.1 NYN domain-containing protein [Nocardioides sp. ChNu-153]
MTEPVTPQRRTFVLVDGENIDATLGNSLLGRRPTPEERPRWERVTAYAEQLWDQPVTGLFFLNASGGSLPSAFVQALLALGYRPVPLAGRGDQKVVDLGIQRTLQAVLAHDADVLLVSHDGDFLDDLRPLVEHPDRRVGLLALREYANAGFTSMGVRIHDLEDDVRAFNVPLPRVRIIPLEEFDPELFLR